MRPKYLPTLVELIEIDTSVPPGKNYPEAIAYLLKKFKTAGCQTESVRIPRECTRDFREPRINLLAHRRNSDKPRLLFYTHIDVIPVKGWKGFKARVEDGRVFGRGAADMKGGIVALLLGLEKVKGKKLGWDVSVMVTTDEEMLGCQASQLEYLGQLLSPREAYVWDLDCDAGLVTIANLGTIQMEIEVKGKSVHSALSHLGVNAVEQTSHLLNALLRLKKKVAQKKSAIPVHPDGKIGSGVMEPRLNINVIKGGWKANVVPDLCQIWVDRRIIPEENLDEAELELTKTIDKARKEKKLQCQITKILRVPPYASYDPIADKLIDLSREVTGEELGKFGGMGSSDLPGVAKGWKAKLFGLGVARPESNIHGKDESVSLRDIENLGETIGEFLLRGNPET